MARLIILGFLKFPVFTQTDQAAGPYPGKMKSPLANSVQPSRTNMIHTVVRRSTCTKDTVDTPLNHGIQIKDHVIAHVIITESDEEEDQYDFEDDELLHEMSTLFEENTEDKIDYLIQVLEAQGKKLDTLVSKVSVFVTLLLLCIFLG